MISNIDLNLRAFIITEDEWERLAEIESMLKVSYKFKKLTVFILYTVYNIILIFF